MKFSNPTARKTFRRCPKRFHYRYFYRPESASDLSAHRRRLQLCGIRELAGDFIHRTIAKMVRAIADGDHSWDYAKASQECWDEFSLVVAKSLAAEPGQLIGGLQLAETYNGLTPAEIKDDVNHWRGLIPVAIETAFRTAHELQIRHATSTYSVEAEKEIMWTDNGMPMRFIIDVLTQSPSQTVVIDWKTHEIDNADVFQIRNYLRWLHKVVKVPSSKLFGFAVNLRTGECVEVNYNPYRFNQRSTTATARDPRLETEGGKDLNSPSPHPELCQSCAYATLCPDSALAGPLPISRLNHN